MVARRLFLLTILFALLSAPNSAVAAERVFFVDLVAVDFPGGMVSSGELLQVRDALSETSIPYWNRELQDDNQGRRLSLGQVDFNLIPLNIPPSCDGSGAQRYIRFVKSEFYKRHSGLPLNNRYLVIYTPRSSCIWEAISSLNEVGTWDGGMILNGTTKAFVVSHELGHALGLGHTNLIACQNGKREGAWGTECRGIEYGGAIDLMGNVDIDSPLSTYHRWRLGTLPASGVKQSWLDEDILLNDIDTNEGLRAILIREKDATYWIEYRSKRMGDYLPGLVFYRTDPPPASAISSPNPEDEIGATDSSRISTDVWLINLGDYRYLSGKAAGSMALPPKTDFVIASGAVTISASVRTETSVVVSIDRVDDRNPPPSPRILSQSDWTAPSTSIFDTSRDFWDRETFISSYEIQAGERIFELSREDSGWKPDLINPLIPPRAVTAQDLPEGSYSLRIRAVDVWGNRSAWSETISVSIDRGFPSLSPRAFVESSSGASKWIKIEGVADAGSEICKTRFLNSEGFVVAQNEEEDSRKIRFNKSLSSSTQFQTFDCSGNGISVPSTISVKEQELSKVRKTGVWKLVQDSRGRSLDCRASCSASFSSKGLVSIFGSKGTGRIFINGKLHSQFSKPSSNDRGPIARIDLGNSSATIRITGSNLSLESIQSINWRIGNSVNLFFERKSGLSDEDVVGQSSLAKLGFRTSDFDGNWTLQPLSRGYLLQDPSLDFCSDRYESEKNRVLRRQLVSFKPGTSYSFVSTEVVNYRNQSSAREAFRELSEAISKCQLVGGFTNKDGVEEKYDFLKIKPQILNSETGLEFAYLRVKIGEGQQARWLLAYYNFKDDKFSGLYIVKAGSDFSSQEVNNWNSVNSILVSRLEES